MPDWRTREKNHDPRENLEKARAFQQRLEEWFNHQLARKAELAKTYAEIIESPKDFIELEKIIDDYRGIIEEQKKHVLPEILNHALAEKDLDDYVVELAILTFQRNKERKEREKRELREAA